MQKAARDGGHHILSTALQNSHIYTICYPFQLLTIVALAFSQQRLMPDLYTALSLFFCSFYSAVCNFSIFPVCSRWKKKRFFKRCQHPLLLPLSCRHSSNSITKVSVYLLHMAKTYFMRFAMWPLALYFVDLHCTRKKLFVDHWDMIYLDRREKRFRNGRCGQQTVFPSKRFIWRHASSLRLSVLVPNTLFVCATLGIVLFITSTACISVYIYRAM